MEASLLFGIETKNSTEIQNATQSLWPNPKKRPQGNPEEWRLGEMIKGAQKLGLIAQQSAQQCDLARNYRNLIHPGRLRQGEACDRATALGALGGCEIVVRELS